MLTWVLGECGSVSPSLGGNLTMESNSGVTTVFATFPISIAATTSNEELAVV